MPLEWLGQRGITWTDNAMGVINTDKRASLFRKLIADLPIHSILEIGCNMGYNLVALSKVNNYDLTGIDYMKYAVDHAYQSAGTIICDDFRTHPFPDESFDLVLALGFFDSYSDSELIVLAEKVCQISKQYILVLDYPFMETKNFTWHCRDYEHAFPGFEEVFTKGFLYEVDPMMRAWLVRKVV